MIKLATLQRKPEARKRTKSHAKLLSGAASTTSAD